MRAFTICMLMLVFSYPVLSQTCAGYYFFNQQAVDMITYDNSGKENGKLAYTISEITRIDNEFIATFATEEKNKSGVVLSRVPGKYKCGNGSLYMDVAIAIPKEQMAPYKDMDIRSGLAFIEYPKLAAGQTFRDTSFTLEVFNGGALYSTLTLTQANRKVEVRESINNRTGTWDCVKITYDGKITTKTGSAPATVFNFKCKEWYAPGFGLIKSETYSGSNALISSFAITAVKK